MRYLAAFFFGAAVGAMTVWLHYVWMVKREIEQAAERAFIAGQHGAWQVLRDAADKM